MFQVNLLSRNDQGSIIGAPNWINNRTPFYDTGNLSDSFNSYEGSFRSDYTLQTPGLSPISEQWTPDSSYELPLYSRRRVSPRGRNPPREYSQITPGAEGGRFGPKVDDETPPSIRRHKAKLVAQFKPKVLKSIIPPTRDERHKRALEGWNNYRTQAMTNLEKHPIYHPNYYNSPGRIVGRPKIGGSSPVGNRLLRQPPNSFARSYDYFGNKYEVTQDDAWNRTRTYTWDNMGPITRPVDFSTPKRSPKSPVMTWTEGDSYIKTGRTPTGNTPNILERTPPSATARLLADIKTPESIQMFSPMQTLSDLDRQRMETKFSIKPTSTRFRFDEDDDILDTPVRGKNNATPDNYIDPKFAYKPNTMGDHVRANHPEIARVRQLAYKDINKNLFDAPTEENYYGYNPMEY